ncbi:MAG: PhzF family phenazine biosynthesis protein [Cyclobacteriaceae bacterium]
MHKIKIYQVDAFTDRLFAGNPAAVCPLEEWIPDKTMQAIAAENNLAETAFIVREKKQFQIRWFTPTIEVDLCGHATLASAFVLFDFLGHKEKDVKFYSPRSGNLGVSKEKDILFLDFPTDTLYPVGDSAMMRQCIGSEPLEIYKGKTDFIAVVENEYAVQALAPDLKEISRLPARGLIVTARGNQVDFVSRFFGPQSGVDEDPVTGSAHTSLIPLWSGKLGKNEMVALQLSKRGGKLICINKGERCLIGGSAKLYMTGEINVE